MRIWRKPSKSGSVPFEGAAYILPYGDEQKEFLKWLAEQVSGLSGEAAFVEVERVPPAGDDEIISLFHRRKERDLGPIEAALEQAERKIGSLRQSGGAPALKRLAARIEKVRGDFEEARKTDFFDSAPGAALEDRIRRARAAFETLTAASREAARPPRQSRRARRRPVGRGSG